MSDLAGVSLATWRLLETAGRERYQGLTLRGVTRALGWSDDAIDRLLEGPVDGDALRVEGRAADHRSEGGPADEVPVGFSSRWRDLTPQERAKVLGFVDGLLAGRPGGSTPLSF